MSNSKLFTVRVNPDTDTQQAENLSVLMKWKENGELKARIMDAISHYIDSPY